MQTLYFSKARNEIGRHAWAIKWSNTDSIFCMLVIYNVDKILAKLREAIWILVTAVLNSNLIIVRRVCPRTNKFRRPLSYEKYL